MTPFRAVLYSPANKMQEQTETFGAPPSLLDPDSRAQKAVLCNATTYLAKIAIVLQDAPEKMLTFSQVKKKKDSEVTWGSAFKLFHYCCGHTCAGCRSVVACRPAEGNDESRNSNCKQ